MKEKGDVVEQPVRMMKKIPSLLNISEDTLEHVKDFSLGSPPASPASPIVKNPNFVMFRYKMNECSVSMTRYSVHNSYFSI